MKTSIFLLMVLIVKTIDGRLFKGRCRCRPSPLVYPFKFNQYLGIWYEIEWYDDDHPTYDECIKFTYTETRPYQFNMTLDLKDAKNKFTSAQYQGHGKFSDPVQLQGQLSTTFDKVPPLRVNHQVLATDYKNYAFVWDCFNVNETHYNERMWYFDRKPNPGSRPLKVEQLIRDYFDGHFIRKTYHGPRCYY